MGKINPVKSISFVSISIVPTFIGLFLAILSTGAGHGDYLFAKLFFPYSMFLAIALGEITLFSLIIALVQFPIYAVILSFAGSRKSIFTITFAIIFIHISAFALCFFGGSGF